MGGSVAPGSTKSSWLRHRMVWLPPFLVGLAGATAGEMATGLLLYSSEGLLRALTVVLVTELSALGVGFLTSRRVSATDVDGLRRRWLVAVFSFAAAAVFAGAWGLSPGLSASPLSQGLGLGLLAALPFFSVGAVLGALSPTGNGSVGPAVATPASFGAAAGLLFTGLFGVPSFQPASLLLFCVVVVSAGALLHGWMMDRTVRVLPLDVSTGPGGPGRRGAEGRSGRSPSGAGDLRWERRVRTSPRSELRVLLVGDSVADAAAVDGSRTGEDGDGGVELRACLPWQRHVLEVVEETRRERKDDLGIFVMGVGTDALLAALEDRGCRKIVALEPRGFRIAPDRGDEDPIRRPETSISYDWSEVATSAPADGFDIVIVNLRLLPRDGPFQELDLRLLERALALRGSGSVALVGGVRLHDDEVVRRTLEWLSSRCGIAASLFRPEAGTWTWDDEPWDDLLRSLGDLGGGLLACRPDHTKEDAGPSDEGRP